MSCRLILGDCLERMKEIPDGSVDLVLTDPPYGTMKGINLGGWTKESTKWDECLPVDEMFSECSRVLRSNGKCVLFAQEPLTSRLVTGAIPSLPFSYRAVWVKNDFANFLGCNKAMVSLFEDICIFQNKIPNKSHCDATKAFAEFVAREGIDSVVDAMMDEGRYKDRSSAKGNLMKRLPGKRSSYDSFADKDLLEFLDEKIGIGFSIEWYLNEVEKHREANKPTFNLWQGGKSKSNVLEYPKDSDHYHPTQKPVALLEDLIQTFSNPGDTVLDFTMGSGSTGVACVNTGREFIGIELDEHYFEVAEKRIEDAEATPRLVSV